MERLRDGLDGELYERWTWLSPTTCMSWWTRLYPKRKLLKRPRETKRGRLVFLQAAKLTKSFTLWRRMSLTRPNNLQLDVGRWSLNRASLQGTSNSATHSSRLPSLMHPHVTLVMPLLQLWTAGALHQWLPQAQADQAQPTESRCRAQADQSG
jgi:hypothetical protein